MKDLSQYGIKHTRTVTKRENITVPAAGKQKGGSRIIDVTLADIGFERTEKADPEKEPAN